MIRTNHISSMLAGATLLAILQAGGAAALDLQLPNNARLALESNTDPDSYAMPNGPVVDGVLPVTLVDGAILRQAWQIDTVGQSTLRILAPLRQQLEDDRFVVLFECEAKSCGGFDFRFQTDVIPAPDMHIDLFDFRFLTAQRGAAERAEYITLLVSKSSVSGFVQLYHIAPSDGTAIAKITADATPQPSLPTIVQSGSSLTLARALEKNGHVVLSDLTFETGSSTLGAGDFTSLSTLATYLLANPDRKIALVGHTDSQGTLTNNIALSKRRAASVVERLAKVHNVPRDQITGEGMGYLAPRASNLTPEGRETNRRVEAVLLNIE